MRGVFRILAKDAAELIANPRMLLLSFIVPPIMLLLVGQLDVHPPAVKVVMSGLANCEDLDGGEDIAKNPAGQQQAPEDESTSEEPPEETVFRGLREISYVSVTCRSEAERDPFARLSGQGIDLLLNNEDARWTIYVAETNPRRVAWLLDLAYRISLTHQTVLVSKKAEPLLMLGALPLRPAFLYYPQSANKSLALIPMTFSLIVCFLAFIIAAPSLIRERELHTLEILLGAPGIGGGTVLAGKALLPIVVSLFAGTFMLVVVQAVYGLSVKADVALFLLVMVLPILSSTLLGLLVSALARSQAQTVMASAVYFFCLFLLSGFLYPTEAGSAAVRFVTQSFGLTYLLDPANAWFFGAEPFRGLHLTPLVIQCVVYAALAGFAWRRQLRRI